MTIWRKWACVTIAICCAAMGGSRIVAAWATAHASQDKTERARVALSHALPSLDGRHLKVTIVEVTYGPGESSMPHSHPCPVVGYVAEGTLRTQVEGEAEEVYKAGESFYEAPNGVHMISANASDKKPVKLLAYFVCDHEAPLSLAMPKTKGTGGK